MVRFIMNNISDIPITANAIYIPIWLDLLLYSSFKLEGGENKFTFQYG